MSEVAPLAPTYNILISGEVRKYPLILQLKTCQILFKTYHLVCYNIPLVCYEKVELSLSWPGLIGVFFIFALFFAYIFFVCFSVFFCMLW